ncbi:hypothetical protein HHK36_007639 [Tetracentron sinense]|uniref:Uncharacterized protein n=1 Tax=Tetracentron sinense TaxID=13715 RepID=A0A835DQ11_TETSI|nr:hypothetical protein HHK36_007639 [Tetracentron sinense]
MEVFTTLAQVENYPPRFTFLLFLRPICVCELLCFLLLIKSSKLSNSNLIVSNSRKRVRAQTPYLSQGIDSSSDVFQRIQMKYIDDDEGIKKYFAAFHLHDTFPVAVIVDDFGDFFDDRNCQERYSNPRGRDLAMVRTLALCHDAIIHANERGPCKLLLSDTHHGDTPRLLFIYKRWIPSIFTIRGLCSSEKRLEVNNIPCGSKWARTAKYSIALQYLLLEEIIDDSVQ